MRLRWRRSKPRLERCETCSRDLKPRQVVEVTEMFTDDLGGTAITAIFCRTHAPKEAA